MSKVTIVAYHYVRPIAGNRYPGIKGLEFEKFKRQIAYLKENYSIITIEKLLEAMDGGGSLPDNPCLLTFDDGYTDHFDYVFPVLDKEGLQGSFYIPGRSFTERKLLDVNKIHFILASAPDISLLLKDVKEMMDHYRGREFDYPPTDELWEELAKPGAYDGPEVIFIKRILQNALPERLRGIMADALFEKHLGISETALANELYMTHEQIAAMKKHGMFIGLHGYNHYWLGKLPRDKMEEDITKALDVMEPFLDRKAWVMNYPYGLEGAWNEDVLSFIKEQGCVLGFSVTPRVADIETDNRLLLPRIDTNEVPVKP